MKWGRARCGATFYGISWNYATDDKTDQYQPDSLDAALLSPEGLSHSLDDIDRKFLLQVDSK
jgi:hypothetical protein